MPLATSFATAPCSTYLCPSLRTIVELPISWMMGGKAGPGAGEEDGRGVRGGGGAGGGKGEEARDGDEA